MIRKDVDRSVIALEDAVVDANQIGIALSQIARRNLSSERIVEGNSEPEEDAEEDGANMSSPFVSERQREIEAKEKEKEIGTVAK